MTTFNMTNKPVIYFAGKISQCGWRTDITGRDRVGGLDDFSETEVKHLFDADYRIDHGDFFYGGPFFVNCDHGCTHRAGRQHGMGLECATKAPNYPAILEVNTKRILRADLMFTFINEVDCFGTLIELGIALRQRPRVTVAFGPNVTAKQRSELWMAEESACFVTSGEVRDAWRKFARLFLPLYQPERPQQPKLIA